MPQKDVEALGIYATANISIYPGHRLLMSTFILSRKRAQITSLNWEQVKIFRVLGKKEAGKGDAFW